MTSDPKNRRTFVVSAMIGSFVGTPWPFGRLYVSDEAISVRTLSREKTCPKSEITDISLERLGPQNQLRFEDAAGEMADVAVGLAMRVKGVVGELRRRGYPVVDRRSKLFALPQDLPLPHGAVPWRDQDNAEGGIPPRE